MLPTSTPRPQKRTPRTKAAVSKEKPSTHSDEEQWDELFATPESEAFLTLMIAEVRREEAKGKLIEGGWDEI